MDEMEDMVRLLLARDKMLNLHCPRCNLPLFQSDAKIVCVKCGEVRVEKEENTDSDEANKLASDAVVGVIEKKKAELLATLESEKDPEKIVSLVKTISKIEEVQATQGKNKDK